MDLEIRPARADDRGSIAELIYSSGPHIYDYMHGSEAIAFLRHEFASGHGFAGHPHVTVAVLDGEVVGTGCFYDREVYDKRVKGALKNVLTHYGVLRSLPVLARSRHVARYMRRPKSGELYLSNFGVAPRLQSQGIGSRLIAHRLEQARAQGYRLFGLHVSLANPRGQALYTKLGLAVTKEQEFPIRGSGVPPARKMELSL